MLWFLSLNGSSWRFLAWPAIGEEGDSHLQGQGVEGRVLRMEASRPWASQSVSLSGTRQEVPPADTLQPDLGLGDDGGECPRSRLGECLHAVYLLTLCSQRNH